MILFEIPASAGMTGKNAGMTDGAGMTGKEEKYNELSQEYDKISAMLYKLIKNWRKF